MTLSSSFYPLPSFPCSLPGRQITFWQDGCKGTCPAGDGSFASVVSDTSVEAEEESESSLNMDDRHIFWFFVITAGLCVLVIISWIALCYVCVVRNLLGWRERRASTTIMPCVTTANDWLNSCVICLLLLLPVSLTQQAGIE